MGNGILSRISWSATLVFMLIRIGFGSLALFVFFVLTGAFSQGGMPLGSVLVLPLFVLMLSAMSLIAAWLSQVGVPFAGLISYGCSIPMYLGDPMVWLLHKFRPQWVPINQPSFVNPPMVWVLNE